MSAETKRQVIEELSALFNVRPPMAVNGAVVDAITKHVLDEAGVRQRSGPIVASMFVVLARELIASSRELLTTYDTDLPATRLLNAADRLERALSGEPHPHEYQVLPPSTLRCRVCGDIAHTETGR